MFRTVSKQLGIRTVWLKMNYSHLVTLCLGGILLLLSFNFWRVRNYSSSVRGNFEETKTIVESEVNLNTRLTNFQKEINKDMDQNVEELDTCTSKLYDMKEKVSQCVERRSYLETQINDLEDKIRILESNSAAKDARIISLGKEMDKMRNMFRKDLENHANSLKSSSTEIPQRLGNATKDGKEEIQKWIKPTKMKKNKNKKPSLVDKTGKVAKNETNANSTVPSQDSSPRDNHSLIKDGEAVNESTKSTPENRKDRKLKKTLMNIVQRGHQNEDAKQGNERKGFDTENILVDESPAKHSEFISEKPQENEEENGNDTDIDNKNGDIREGYGSLGNNFDDQ